MNNPIDNKKFLIALNFINRKYKKSLQKLSNNENYRKNT